MRRSEKSQTNQISYIFRVISKCLAEVIIDADFSESTSIELISDDSFKLSPEQKKIVTKISP